MRIRTWDHPRIPTRDRKGGGNGFLIPIFNVHEQDIDPAQHPQQVYLTVVSPRRVKGPHLHLKRWGLFTCIKGNIRIVVRDGNGYTELHSGERHAFRTIQVPAGTAAALENLGPEDAYVLNMPSPAWRPDDQDEHAAAFDDYCFCDDLPSDPSR